MKRSSLATMLFLCCAVVAIASKPPPMEGSTINLDEPNVPIVGVSAFRLLSQPEKYDGKVVRTIGAFESIGEGGVLFVSKEFAAPPVNLNGFSLDLSQLPKRDLRAYSGRMVLIEGLFRVRASSEFGGHLAGVMRLDVWK